MIAANTALPTAHAQYDCRNNSFKAIGPVAGPIATSKKLISYSGISISSTVEMLFSSKIVLWDTVLSREAFFLLRGHTLKFKSDPLIKTDHTHYESH